MRELLLPPGLLPRVARGGGEGEERREGGRERGSQGRE